MKKLLLIFVLVCVFVTAASAQRKSPSGEVQTAPSALGSSLNLELLQYGSCAPAAQGQIKAAGLNMLGALTSGMELVAAGPSLPPVSAGNPSGDPLFCLAPSGTVPSTRNKNRNIPYFT
jgi:hypothetical protein